MIIEMSRYKRYYQETLIYIYFIVNDFNTFLKLFATVFKYFLNNLMGKLTISAIRKENEKE